MGEFKPAVLQSKFLPSLAGTHTKMSSDNAILLSDLPKMVRKKINKALSGGGATVEEHRRLGANLSVDVPLRYLHCFAGLHGRGAALDLDDVDRQYARGELLSGQVKQMAAEAVSAALQQHLSAREAVSDHDVALFMTRRQLL